MSLVAQVYFSALARPLMFTLRKSTTLYYSVLGKLVFYKSLKKTNPSDRCLCCTKTRLQKGVKFMVYLVIHLIDLCVVLKLGCRRA